MSALLNELERLRAQNSTLLAALREALPVVEKLQELIAKHHPGFELRQTAIVRAALEGGAQIGQGEPVAPVNCRQRLKSEGKAYPKSNCASCGEFSPKWKECDAMLAAAPQAPQASVVQQEPVAWWYEVNGKVHLEKSRLDNYHVAHDGEYVKGRPLVFGDTHPAQQAKPQPQPTVQHLPSDDTEGGARE